MDIAKSLFGNRPHEGYAGKEDYNVSVEVLLEKLLIWLCTVFSHMLRLSYLFNTLRITLLNIATV
jgi:hypothetical protein